MSSGLPSSVEVPVACLAGAFRSTTNSYKFLWLLALLDAVERRERRLPVRSLVAGMLAHAWHPLLQYRLSFGTQDRVAQAIAALARGFERGPGTGRIQVLADWIESRLPEDAFQLARYVATRLLRPFFVSEVRHLPDSKVDAELAALSRRHFEERRPLYRVDESARCVTLHPAWTEYLTENLSIVRGFVFWEWLQYLQARNPSTPNLAAKLLHDARRGSLRPVVEQWRAFGLLRCLYSGRVLGPGDLEVDHFVPWAFVAHDQPWNLVPSAREINGRKRDALPAWERHRKALVEHQFRWLRAARIHLPKRSWRELSEPWVVDLKLPIELMESSEELALRASLQEALNETVPNLLALAHRQGFPVWEPGAGGAFGP